MTSKRDIEKELDEVSERTLEALPADSRLKMTMGALADGDLDTHERLMETAPRKEYTATELEYTDGTKKLTMLSLTARHELQKLYQIINQHESTRDQFMALMLLNESLSRLSRGEFDVDEFGIFDAPDHADADYAYGKEWGPATAWLATKYRELWEDLPVEMPLDETERERPYFPSLAAGASAAYPSDLSGEAFDDLEVDRIQSDLYMSEVKLANALADFYTRFHGWRLFAEEHLDVSLDELLNLSVLPGEEDGLGGTHGIAEINADLCENILSLKRDYLDAHPALLEDLAEKRGEEPPDSSVDLDARAEEFAESIAEEAELPF